MLARMSRTANAPAIDPADYVGIVGSSFAKHDHTALIDLSAHARYDRVRLGQIGAPHPSAALAINRVAKELRIRSVAELARRLHELGTYKGLGVTAYWVVLAILRDAGYDVVKLHAEPVTYATVKARTRKAALKAIAEKRRRKRRAGPPSDADNP